MTSQRQSFGGSGRIPPTVDGGGIIVAPLVSVVAQQVDNSGGTLESGVIGMIIPDADNRDPTNNGVNARWMAVASLGYALRQGGGGNIDRLRSSGSNADAHATQAVGILSVMSHPEAFNGTTWDRVRSGGAAILGGLSSFGALLTVKPGMWSVTHTPAAATQATITRAAGGAGVRHVCNSIHAVLIIQPTIDQPVIQVNLRDGATGAGTILWSRNIGVGAALANGGEQEVSLSGLEIVGTANTAMTLEFSAAGAAGTIESVAMTGHDAS